MKDKFQTSKKEKIQTQSCLEGNSIVFHIIESLYGYLDKCIEPNPIAYHLL